MISRPTLIVDSLLASTHQSEFRNQRQKNSFASSFPVVFRWKKNVADVKRKKKRLADLANGCVSIHLAYFLPLAHDGQKIASWPMAIKVRPPSIWRLRCRVRLCTGRILIRPGSSPADECESLRVPVVSQGSCVSSRRHHPLVSHPPSCVGRGFYWRR